VIGGAGDPATSANGAKGKPVLGGLTGAGGAYLIGANWDMVKNRDSVSSDRAVEKARSSPALPQEARTVSTADINNDGFITVDEVAAMQKAGFSDDEMIHRLELTGQVFDISQQTESTLRGQGVSRRVIDSMKSMNRTPPGHEVLSQPD
jgi:hypothetical protein